MAACVQYAAEKHIPVHARGAGSGVAGESLGPGLVLDFSKFLRRIVRIEEDTVRVQPGMVHERLNAQLRLRGRLFGPDPANSAVTTIGSMIAMDASGSRWLKYGSVAPPRAQPASGAGRRPTDGAGPRAAGRRRPARTRSAEARPGQPPGRLVDRTGRA